MAHLLHNPFQKPFEFPRQGPLLTPPETEPEHQTQHQTVPLPSTNGLGIELEPAPTHRSISVTEVPISRRTQYIQSGPREARERTVHRSVRWLVVVTPPLSFSQEHGSFGHNLSVGSPERLSQGILMPLLQTMSSQLSAIAREFAFPSTAGLCLYLHTSHGGISITPRITDESWPLLWAHLFEPRSPTASTSAPQLPIGGRIEFDIDPTKARWLDAWLGLLRRENLDVPVSAAPSRRGSLSHLREDSRTSFHDDRTEEPLDGAPVILPPRPSRTPGHRHVPRKLSLLDRLESASARSGSRLATRTANSPSPPAFLDAPQRPSIGLSPIVQEDEPKTAQKDIDVFVNSWRASASIAVPSPFHATGQTSLDPVNLPNNIEITGDDEDVRSELDLNDFQWSVSSVGPPEYDTYDYEDDNFDTESWRLPSVHMDRRGEGSVCLTPTTCTSWGPSDFDLELDAQGLYASHFAALAMEPTYSPDIATRMLEDCPPTPSTATSWGPPLEWPPSPVRSELSYVGSVDLGQRAMSEVPLTPSTATSWGPPLSYPPSPATPYHVLSPDIGQRTFDIEVPRLALAPRPRRLDADAEVGEGESAEPWRNVWPYISTTSASAEASPYAFVFPQRPSTPPPLSPSEPTTLQPQQTAQSPAPFAFGWPFFDVSTEATPAPAGVQAPPEHSVEPVDHELEDVEEQTQKPRVKKISPFTVVFEDDSPATVAATAGSRAGEEEDAPASHVWPYFDASSAVEVVEASVPGPSTHTAPSQPSTTSREVADAPTSEHAAPWTHVWPYTEDELAPFRALSHIWPYSSLFNADAPVPDGPWNFVWPYPKPVYNGLLMKEDSKARVDYPFFNLYPAVYPQFELYPEVTGTLHHRAPTKLVVELEATYPAVQPYRSVYPHLEIYPGAPMSNVYTNVVVSLSPEEKSYYPAIDLYGPVYPLDVQMYPWNVYSLYPASKGASKVDGPVHSLVDQVYPWNVYNLYPAIKGALKPQQLSSLPVSTLTSDYPWNVYNLYPAVDSASKSQQLEEFPVLTLTPGYPTLNLYAPVYPYNLDNIYPPVKADIEGVTWTDTLSIRLEAVYPAVQIYAPVYPHNVENIYPAVKVEKSTEASSSSSGALKALEIRLPAVYPNMTLYSPVYPHNVMEIYPAVVASTRKSSSNGLEPIVVRLSASYPTLDIYPVGYPWSLSNIYPSIVAETLSRIVVLEHKTEYPHIQPYRPVYPYNVEAIYPAVTVTVEEKRPVRSANRHKNPVHRTQHSHHAKRSLSTSKIHVPPVPPLPQNVQSWRPINPTSRAPLSGKRVYVGLPVQLAPQYPRICPYPSVYPHLEIYPELPAENVVRPVAPRRKAKHTHLELHQLVFASTSSSGFAPRRKPKFTHLQLHEKIFGPIVSPPTSPRRLPVPPQIAVPPRPALSIVEPTSAISQSPSSASPSTRARSGTVSQRPVLPTPPPPQADSPPKLTRRLPSIPQNGSPRGLPSDPAMIRRTSMMPVVNKSPSFSPLSTVPEPSELHPEPLSSSPTRRPLPQQPRPYASPATPDSPVLPRSARPLSTLPPLSQNNSTSQGLSRSNTLPQRPTPRSRRGTLTTGPSGIVAGLTKAFDSNDVQVPPPPSLSSTLSQFPTPPRPPLPPIPGGRPVSKLDRSRYPYN